MHMAESVSFVLYRGKMHMKYGATVTKARDYLLCLCREWLSFDISL